MVVHAVVNMLVYETAVIPCTKYIKGKSDLTKIPKSYENSNRTVHNQPKAQTHQTDGKLS